MMWEEHPEYQKAQMRLTGLLLVCLVVLGVILAIQARDWDLLRQILLMAGGLIIAVGLVSGVGWTLVKIFTRKPVNDSKPEVEHEA